MASTDNSTTTLGDITECSICLETWKDPRSLPSCHHTFCLQCIKTYADKKDEENEKLMCPVCRKEFTVPQHGFEALPKNFIHQQLLDAKRASVKHTQVVSTRSRNESPEALRTMCELCTINIVATTSCIDCDQNMCKACSAAHLRTRIARSHKIIELSVKENSNLIRRQCTSFCKEHVDEQVKLYCEKCQKLLCTICHATGHVGHQCTATKNAAEVFAERLARCQVGVDSRKNEIECYLYQLERKKNEFLGMVSDNESNLHKKKKDLQQLIEAEHAELWNKLKEIKEIQLKEINTRMEEVNRELLTIQVFKKTSKMLIQERSYSDICHSANDLLAEADVLGRPSRTSELCQFTVSFKPAKIPEVNNCAIHLVGLVQCTGFNASISTQLFNNQNTESPEHLAIDVLFENLGKNESRLQQQLQQLEAELKQAKDDESRLQQQLQQRQAELSWQQQQLQQLQAELKQAKGDESRLQQQLQQRQAELSWLQQQLQQVQAELKLTKEESHGMNANCQQLQGKLDEMTLSRDQKATYAQHLTKQLQCLEDEQRRTQVEVRQLTDKLKSLEEKVKQEKCQKLLKEPVVRSPSFLGQSSLLNVLLSSGGQAVGLAVVGNDVIIGRNADTHLKVADRDNVILTPRQMKISDLTLDGPRLAFCSHYRCLYVRHGDMGTIRRVDLSDSILTISAWEVKEYCAGLSVANNANVLATLRDSRRVHEYTTNGIFVREIHLNPSIQIPIHCVQLSNGNYAVSHRGDAQHRVCIVDFSGNILNSYGGFAESGGCRFNFPYHLTVTKQGHMFVSDSKNDRVQLLSPTLTLIGTIQTPGHQLICPLATCFDEANNRLYIGQQNGCVLVVNVSII